MGAVIQRWTVGKGGFIGEASLVHMDELEVRIHQRKGRFICELTDVYVHPMRRGKGWARSVVQAAIEHADAEGWDVFLRVVSYGTKSAKGGRRKLAPEELMAFYGRFGFVSRKAAPRCMVRRWRAS